MTSARSGKRRWCGFRRRRRSGVAAMARRSASCGEASKSKTSASICGSRKQKGSETGSATTWGRRREARGVLRRSELTGKHEGRQRNGVAPARKFSGLGARFAWGFEGKWGGGSWPFYRVKKGRRQGNYWPESGRRSSPVAGARISLEEEEGGVTMTSLCR